MPADLSISIVNTSNRELLRGCLHSLYGQRSRYTIDVLVTDNASADGSAEMVRSEFPEVILTVNVRRLGFSENNNKNLRKSTGRFLMLLNEDTIVQPGCLDRAVSFLDGHPDISGVACRMLYPDGSMQEGSTRRLPTIATEFMSLSGLQANFPRSRWLAAYVMGDADHARPFRVELPLEAGMIVRRSMVDRVGLLHEGYFIFGEGPEWCHRMKEAGGAFMYLPDCEIVHFGGSSLVKTPRLAIEVERFRSHCLYFRRVHGRTYAAAYRALVLALHLSKVVSHSIAYVVGRNEANRRRLALDGLCILWSLGIDAPQGIASWSSRRAFQGR